MIQIPTPTANSIPGIFQTLFCGMQATAVERRGEAAHWGQHWAGLRGRWGWKKGARGCKETDMVEIYQKERFLSTAGGPAEQTSFEDQQW